MSIAASRLLAYVDKITQEAMRLGELPDPHSVRQALNEFARDRSLEGPSLRYRAQPRRGQFRMNDYNSMVMEVVEDLNFAFAEQIDQTNRLLKAVNETETKYRAFQHQIETLEDLLEVLLLVEPKASGYFYALGDQFRDLNLVDQQNTTAGIDLSSGIVHLPAAAGMRKVALSHLASRASVRMGYDNVSEVLAARQISGSRFGYAFDDTAQGWQFSITTGNPNGWSGYVTVPVAVKPMDTRDTGMGAARTEPMTPEEIYISRIDVDGLTGTEMEVKVRYSVDGVNFLNLPGHDWVNVSGRRVTMVFERLKVEYLRIHMRKTTPDDEGLATGHYQYAVGLKNVSLYDVGYAIEGELVSKELDPDLDTDIGRVTLEVGEHVPAHTDIEYYVAPYSASPAWQRVQPGGRLQAEASPILDFSKSVLSPRRDNAVRVTSTPALNSSRNGISFYNIMAMNGSQVPESVRLYRGIDGWRMEANTQEEIVTVRDNYVVFTRSDGFQKLYLEMEEEITSPPTSVGGANTTITVARRILSDDPSINVKPSAGVSVSQQIPNYAIKEVLLLPATAVSGAGTVTVVDQAGSRTVAVSMTGMTAYQIQEGHQIHITQGAVTGLYTVLSALVDSSGAGTYGLADPDRDLISGAATYSISMLDVTQQVLEVDQNTFALDSSATIVANDRLKVVYRSPLENNEYPISSSIAVKDSQGGTTYEAGRDYVFDPDVKGVTRRPEGRIAITGDSMIVVRVDFRFRRDAHRLDTYTTWLKYEGDGSPIDFTTLSVDHEAGEAIYFEASPGRILDLCRISQITGIVRGWRRLTVLSKPVSGVTGVVDTSSAVYKVVNATDSVGGLLFGNRLFSEKRAVREPLKPVTLFYLQTSVGKDDRSVFALSGNNIVVNWNPAETTGRGILYLNPGAGSVQNREHFELQYRYAGADTTQVTSLLFRAVLTRREDQPADRTPLLHWYNLRIAR